MTQTAQEETKSEGGAMDLERSSPETVAGAYYALDTPAASRATLSRHQNHTIV